MFLLSTDIDRPLSVLFVCRDNSRLSQIAEAVLKDRCTPWLKVYSAGMSPSSSIDPFILSVLSLAGISTAGFEPKHWSDVVNEKQVAIDAVVLMGDGISEDALKHIPGEPEFISWTRPIPSRSGGSHHAAWRALQTMRPMIDTLIDDLNIMRHVSLTSASIPAE